MRLFFGIPLDPSAIIALTDVQDSLKHQFRHSKVAWVAPENFHITLHFLGEVDSATDLIERTRQQTFPALFEIRFTYVDAFPSKKDPQTLLVHVEQNPSLFGVYKRLGDVLAGLGFDIDERPFRPHVTLGRIHSRAEVLKPELINVNVSFIADHVILYQSESTPQVSVYTTIHKFSL